MRIVVVGCGGIGGILAARLTRGGFDVTPVTGNAAIAGALASDGYRVREFDGQEWSVPTSRPPVVTLADLPPGEQFDLCVVATKATTLVDAVTQVLPRLAPGAPVLCCQNGLPEELAASVAGRAQVLGCVVVFGATMDGPGVYVATSRGGLQLGRPFAESPETAAYAAVLEQAGLATTVVPDLTAIRWSKLAVNCATSTLGAIGGLRLGSLLRRRFVRRLVLELWTEIVAVARAARIEMAPIGGTLDVAKLSLTDAERRLALGSPALAVKHSVLLAVGVKYRRMRSSMLIALERGRMPEIDFLNGEIVSRGAELGVPTPVNARLVETVRALARGDGKPSIELLRQVYDELKVADEAGSSSSTTAKAA